MCLQEGNMNKSNLENIEVAGISVRTNNSKEMEPSTAQIGALWEKFYGEVAPKLPRGSKVFGLYTNYESDHNGNYDVVACTDSELPKDISGVESFDIKAGGYLVFSEEGDMPQTVFKLWNQIWEYFSSPDCPYKRAYTTDFELYKSENEIEISIAVQ